LKGLSGKSHEARFGWVRLPDEVDEEVVGERRLSGNLEPGMVLAWEVDFRVRMVALPN
jgi:hypothetical protein